MDRCPYDQRVKCDEHERDCKGCFYNKNEYEHEPAKNYYSSEYDDDLRLAIRLANLEPDW